MASFDKDRFTNIIQSKPSLWDSRTPEYTNEKQKEIDWTDVCSFMVNEFRNLPTNLQKTIKCYLKNKWREARNACEREVKTLVENGQDARRFLYILYSKLFFLIPFSEPGRSPKTNEEAINNPKERHGHSYLFAHREKSLDFMKKAEYGQMQGKCRKMDEHQELWQYPHYPFIQTEQPQQFMSRQFGYWQDGELEVPEEEWNRMSDATKQIAIQQIVEMDEERLFLLSLISDFKHIPPQYKTETKLEIIKVIRKYQSLSTSYIEQCTRLPESLASSLFPVPEFPGHSKNESRHVLEKVHKSDLFRKRNATLEQAGNLSESVSDLSTRNCRSFITSRTSSTSSFDIM